MHVIIVEAVWKTTTFPDPYKLNSQLFCSLTLDLMQTTFVKHLAFGFKECFYLIWTVSSCWYLACCFPSFVNFAFFPYEPYRFYMCFSNNLIAHKQAAILNERIVMVCKYDQFVNLVFAFCFVDKFLLFDNVNFCLHIHFWTFLWFFKMCKENKTLKIKHNK